MYVCPKKKSSPGKIKCLENRFIIEINQQVEVLLYFQHIYTKYGTYISENWQQYGQHCIFQFEAYILWLDTISKFGCM